MDRGPDVAPPPIPWLRWIASGLALDAALWLPACRWDLDGWWPRVWLVSLLCWSHLFLLPALFLDPDRSPERLAAVALRGALATAVAEALAVAAGVVTFWVLLFGGLGWMAQGPVPDGAGRWLAMGLFLAPFAAGGIVGALLAARQAVRAQRWRIRFRPVPVAMGGVIAAGALCFPYVQHPVGVMAHGYFALACLALPGLLLTRPRPLPVAPPKWAR